MAIVSCLYGYDDGMIMHFYSRVIFYCVASVCNVTSRVFCIL